MNKSRYILIRDIKKSTVISIIGSTRFYEDMKNVALNYSDKGLTPLMTFVDKTNGEKYNTDENILMIEGYKRIILSDIAIVVNSQGYIGDNTMREIHFAQFVKEIPVGYTVANAVTEKALAGLNIYYRSKISGEYCLIPEHFLYHDHFRNFDDVDKIIDKIFVRKDLKINPEIKEMSDYGKISDPCRDTSYEDSYRFANIYRNHMKNGTNIDIEILDDEEFENNIRNSIICRD